MECPPTGLDFRRDGRRPMVARKAPFTGGPFGLCKHCGKCPVDRRGGFHIRPQAENYISATGRIATERRDFLQRLVFLKAGGYEILPFGIELFDIPAPPCGGANRPVRCFGCTRPTSRHRLAAGLTGWRAALGAHAQHPGNSRRKVFAGV